MSPVAPDPVESCATGSARRIPPRLAALLLASFAGAYYANVALVPLDAMLEHFHTSVGMGTLVLGGFAVPLAAATPIAAYAGEGIGLTRALALALAVLSLGSLAAALAPSFAALVAVRVLQGVAAAVILPGVMVLLASSSSEQERPVAMGMWSSANSLGRVVAVPFGGLLVALAGWSAVFWSAVPVFGLAAVAVAVAGPRRTPRRVPLDRWGAAALTGGATLVLGGLTAVSTGRAGELAGAPVGVAGAALLAVAWRRSRSRAGGLVPVDLFSSPALTRSTVGAFVQMATIMIDVTGVALYLVRDARVSAATAGIVALTFPAAMVLVSALAGAAMARFGGRRVFRTGLALMAAAQGGIALGIEGDAGIRALVVAALGVGGAGAALVQTSTAGGATRPEHREATAAVGIFNLVRFSGTAAGAAWLAIALALGASYQVLFASAGIAAVAALVVTALTGRRGTSLRLRSP